VRMSQVLVVPLVRTRGKTFVKGVYLTENIINALGENLGKELKGASDRGLN